MTVKVEARIGAGTTDPGQFVVFDGDGDSSAPDAAALRITGDLDIRVQVSAVWGNGSFQTLVGRWDPPTNNRSFRFQLDADGRPGLVLTSDGTAGTFGGVPSEATVPADDNTVQTLRVTWRASDGITRFYILRPTGWVQIGSDQQIDIGSIHAGTADLYVGGPENRLEGRVYTAELRDGIDGPVVASPDFTGLGPWNAGDDSTTPARDDDQENPWTLGGSAEIELGWTDLTNRVGFPGGISWSYGRRNEREQPDAGTGTITFDNADRALDPLNESSPFAPHITPMTRVRVTETVGSVEYPILHGFVEGWPPEWEGPGHAWTTVPIVDGFKLLSMARTSVEYPVQQTGERIHALLDRAAWPADQRDIDIGQSEIQAYDASDRIILNALRETADVEAGLFYIDQAGNAVFRDRFNRLAAETAADFNESDLPYETIGLSFDDTELWNDIAVKPLGLSVQRAVDENSKQRYGHRWRDLDNIRITTELEAADRAHWDLNRYKDPRLRITQLTLEGDLFADVYEQIIQRGLGDRITVTTLPAGATVPVTLSVFIEHVSHRITATTFRTVWTLSPAFAEAVWLIGVEGRSELGETTRLGY